MLSSELIAIFIITTATFIFAIFMTPVLTYFLYKYRLGKQIRLSDETPIFTKLHQGKAGTPTMGGILVWGTVLIVVAATTALAAAAGGFFESLNFLSRSETLLPLGMMTLAAFIGLGDDLLGVSRIGPNGGGLQMRHRLILYAFTAAVGAFWFYYKLDWDLLHVPFAGDFNIGWWYIPFFIFIIVASSFSVNETDGLDGLAGGVLLFSFLSLGAIAFLQGRFDLAALCGAIIGGLLAFLWFNIYPARFFMGDTGAMSLGTTLGVIAMLTNTALLLPLIGFVLAAESGSVLLQIFSRKTRGKKLFLSAPIHHHFEAIGWPETKVTMRFWIISVIAAALGLIIYLMDKF